MPRNSYEGEEWRPVRGYEGTYEVSNVGRVRRHEVVTRLLRPEYRPRDYHRSYPRVTLKAGGKQLRTFVHRLVAEAFLGTPTPERIHVNHKDGDRANSSVTNLEWVTPKENRRHAIDTLGVQQGERSHRAVLREHQVISIRERYSAGGVSQPQLAEMYRVTQANIWSIVNRKSWRHI